MGRKSLKDVRQKQILKVFYNLAKTEGLENTSIAKIAKEMGVNPSLIIHYFDTKEDLTYGLIDYILDKYGLIFAKGKFIALDSRDSLFRIIDDIFSKKWNTLFDDSLFYSCYALTFRDAHCKAMYKSLLDSLRTTLCSHIEQCVNDGFSRVKDAAEVADNIFVLVDGAYFYLSLVDDKKEYERKRQRYKQQAMTMLDLVLVPKVNLGLAAN